MGRRAGMGAWLATLTGEQLHALLRARPDAALAPEPRDIGELAARLSGQHSIARVLAQLSLPATQVAEALLALGGSAARADLQRTLGVTDDAEAGRVDQALDELLALALAWPAGAAVRLAGGWRAVLPDPLRLGRSGRELYGLLTVAELGRIGSALGLGGLSRKPEWVDAVAAAAGDPVTAAARLERAAPGLAEVVRQLAWHGPRVSGVRIPHASERVAAHDVGGQLVVQGWVVPTQWGEGEMPREVAMAVRGPDYHAPFDDPPPRPATAAVDPERLREASRHAAGAAVEAVRRLVALLDRAPLATLQAGGVGVRELRRAARQLPADEAAVRLWLETAAAAGLVAPAADAVLATTDADGWLAADPGEALARLLLAWWPLRAVPSHRVDDVGKPAPAVTRTFGGVENARLRADVLGELADLGSGRCIVDPDELVTLLAHGRPLAYGGHDLAPRLRATLAEAALLGLVSDGALTPLGVDLLAATRAEKPAAVLAVAVAGLLPAPTRTATFLPDLTAIVAGGAAALLSRLLDDVADAESRDTASTWRFTPASVRRALDAGRGADELLAALAEVADNPLPQPLDYLVRDVARRHGQLQVFAMASCVRVADAALGAEVAANRALAALNLRLLAATVLASAKPIGDTIAALRKAGYAPVRHDTRGQTVVERAPLRRADAARSALVGSIGRAPLPGVAPPDLAALAAKLSGVLPAPPADMDDGPLAAEEVPRLESAEVAVLAHAIEHHSPVLIDYVNAAGNTSRRVIEPRMKLFGTLVAWCRAKQADRNFSLDRIVAVSPVPG